MGPSRAAGFVDPGWEHAVPQDEKKKKVKCNYCGKIVSGGIYRLKQHLARVSGEVTYCNKAPEEVFLRMKQHLEGQRESKKQQSFDGEEQSSLDLHSNFELDNVGEPLKGQKSKGKQVLDDRGWALTTLPLRSLGFIDPGWEHGVAQDETKKKVKCNYCDKVVSGGINRFKQHLARIPGEVAYCLKAPEEVYLKMKENMKWHRTGRRQRGRGAQEITGRTKPSDNNGDEEQNDEGVELDNCKNEENLLNKNLTGTGKGQNKRSRGRPSSSGTGGTEPKAKKPKLEISRSKLTNPQGTLLSNLWNSNSNSENKACREAISAICKFFYYAAIPYNVADSPYFQKMLDLVAQCGQSLKSPTSRMISSRCLQDEKDTINKYLNEFKVSQAVTGCAILADSWKDVHGKTHLNFLVRCPRGTNFVSSVDATDVIEDPLSLYKLLDKVVDEVGEENVVQVITENTASYRGAGKFLEEKRKGLFWTPCSAHCIDCILEDFAKIKMVEECIGKGKKITRFIYNHPWLLNLMKKEFTGGRDLVRPAISRHATSFFTLQNLLEHRMNLRELFQSDKWLSSDIVKLNEAKEITKFVLNSPNLWKKMQVVRKSVDPIIQVLQRVDTNDGFLMPSIYNDMFRAKLAIKAVHGDDPRKYGPYWNVFDSHSSLFTHPLFVGAYYLNPAYHYSSDFIQNSEVMRGMNDCIARLEPDNQRRVTASMQLSEFNSATADFGTELAISTRAELNPAAWWQQHGINCLELQRLAVRILSQTSSSFGCGHTWSAFDQSLCKRRNRLSQKRLDDLVYVHYNLRLKERQLRKKPEDFTSVDSELVENLLNDWVVETENSMLSQDEEFLDIEMAQLEAVDVEGTEIEDIDAEARKEVMETGTYSIVAPLDVLPPVHAAADDERLDFLDDDLADA